MDTEIVMFFGGPADGEWREVLSEAPQVLVRNEFTADPDPLAQNAWVYKRHLLKGPNGRDYPIYFTGATDPILLLLRSYPVGKNK